MCAGYKIGCVSEERLRVLDEREAKISKGEQILGALKLKPHEWESQGACQYSRDTCHRGLIIALLGIPVAKDGRIRSAAEMYSRFDVTLEQFKKVR